MSHSGFISVGGGVSLSVENTWTAKQIFDSGIKLGIGNRLEWDDDEDSYSVASGDDNLNHFVGGGVKFVMATLTSTFWNNLTARGNMTILDYLKFVVRVGDPGGIANIASFYAKDVAGSAESFTEDEGSNVTQLSSHLPNGEFVLSSKNVRTEKELLIEVEKFMSEKYPEFITINKKDIVIDIKPKWYQLFKKHKIKKVVKISK